MKKPSRYKVNDLSLFSELRDWQNLILSEKIQLEK